MSASAMASDVARITAAIHAVAPRLSDADVTAWGDALRAPMQSSGITTAKRIAAFVGQCAVESGYFAALEENLHYSAGRLLVVWPARFQASGSAEACAGNPQLLANTVYCGRLGNGPPASGDGWKFRGRGLIQLTGRDNYQRFASSLGKSADDIADSLTTKPGAALSACWYWSRIGANALADQWQLTELTKRINGGDEGVGARLIACNAAFRAIGAA
jgi:putative chitinase